MSTTKIQPGGDLHLTALMARHSLNLVTGTDRAALLAYGHDVYAAGQAAAAPDAPAVEELSQAARDVLAERRRQIEAEGYDQEHDDAHTAGEIGALAALYLMPDGARDWDATSTTYGATLGQALLPEDWTMPKMGENRRRDLVKGIACGLAELERWDRVSTQTNGGSAA